MNAVPAPSTNELAQASTKLEELAARANAAHQRVFKATGEGLLAAFEAGQFLLEARRAYAEWMFSELEPHYADLLQYMEYRQEWRS